MNRETEERIVAMHFDNRDFEKNARTTIETLGQLKEGLNLEEAAKGFGVFEKIGKTLNFDKANAGLQKVRNKLSGMSGALGKVFKIGDAPIREAEGMFNTIRGYISKVVGFDLADTLVRSVTNAFRGVTVEPIKAGWNQYELKMDSVKTIMSSTGKSIKTVNKYLEDMTNYANKTVYSLNDMTSNLGKFTNNGVELEDAVVAMEGIANATAHAGQGSQSASMAMYNVSQAIGVGKMTSIDWKSLENANIATSKLKETFLELAAAQGKLEKAKEGDSLVYYLTKDENGKKLKNKIKLTTANFREYLSKGWLDKETMLRTFKVYSGQITDNQLKSWGISDKKQRKELIALGKDALNAAQEVRTFTKMMDALKESVQSGWAETFELLFGDMNKSTKFWTELNDRFGPILENSAKTRNKVISDWKKAGTTVEVYYKKVKKKNGKGTKTVRKEKTVGEGGDVVLQKSLYELLDVVQEVSKAISGAFESVFGKITGKDLYNATVRLRELIKKVKEWLGSADKSGTRLNKLQKALKGILSIVKTVMKWVNKLINLAKKLLAPVVDFLIDKFEKIFGFFDGLGELSPEEVFNKIAEGLQKVWEKIKYAFTPLQHEDGSFEIPFFTWLKDTWEDLKTIVREWAKENGFGFIVDWFDDIKTKIKKAYDDLVNWWEGTGIPGFFRSMWEEITKPFKPVVNEDGIEGDSPIVAFFKNIRAKIEGAYNDVVKWWNKSGIPDFFEGMWNDIVGLFASTLLMDKGEGNDIPLYQISPIEEFFYDFGTKIDMAFAAVEKWWKGSGIPEFFTDMWNAIVKCFEPEEIIGKNGDTDIPLYGPSPIVKFFNGIEESVGGAFESVKSWWNRSGIPEFFTDMWNGIVELFMPKTKTISDRKMNPNLQSISKFPGVKEETYTVTEDSPIVAFFKNMYNGIKSAYEKLENWWNKSTIKTFFTDAWKTVSEWFSIPDDKTGKTGFQQFLEDVGKFLGEAWTTITTVIPWADIGNFFADKWTAVQEWFNTPNEATEKTGFQIFLESVGNGLSEAWRVIKEDIPWESIGKFFTDIWEFISTLITGEQEIDQQTDAANSQSGNTHKGFKKTTKNLADRIHDIKETARTVTKDSGTAGSKKEKTKLQNAIDFVKSIITAVGDFIATVAAAVKGVVFSDSLNHFITNLGDFLKGVLEMAGNILGSIGRVFSGDAKPGDWLTTVIVAVLGSLSQIFQLLYAKNLAGISTNTISHQFFEMATGILFIAGAIALLTTIDQEKMWAAAAVVTVVGVIVAFVMSKINALQETANAKFGNQSGTERVVTRIVDVVGKIGMVAVAMALLPGIIKTMGEVKKDLGDTSIGDDIMKSLIGLTVMMAGVGAVFAALNKIAPSGIEIGPAVKSAVAIFAVTAILITGMTTMFTLVGKLLDFVGKNEVMNSIDTAVETIEKVIKGVGEILGSFFYGLWHGLGGKTNTEKAQESLDILSMIGDSLEVFTDEKVGGISRILNLMKMVTENATTVDSGKVRMFADECKNLGEALNEFIKLANGEEDWAGIGDPESLEFKKYDGIAVFIKKLTEAFAPLSGLNYSNLSGFRDFINNLAEDDSKTGIKKFAQSLRTVIETLGAEGNFEEINFNGVAIVTKLFKEIQDGLYDPKIPQLDATPIVNNLLKSLKIGDEAIAMVIAEMVNNGIKLSKMFEPETGDGTEGTKVEMPEEVNEWLENGIPEVNTSGLEKTVTDLTGENGLINQLTSKIPSLESVFKEKGWMDFTDSEGQPLDIFGMLSEKVGEIGTQINEMDPIKVKITPVFEFENLNAENLKTELGAQSIKLPVGLDAGELSVNFEGLYEELKMGEILSKLEAIASDIRTTGASNASSISGLSGHIDGIASSVSRLRLVLDTGVLVGQITPMVDVALYKREQLAARTGAVNTNGPSRYVSIV